MSIVKFNYFNKEIKVIEGDITLWSGKDICVALDIKDHKQALSSIWDEYKYRGCDVPPTLNIPEQSILLNEAGIYQLIFKSKKRKCY